MTDTTASDGGVTFDGTTYAYRVTAVAANGDELSSEEKTVLCPAASPFWWNFLNVKSVAFPGAAAYANAERVKPHFMSRDKAGTLLAVPMSTDDATHPAVTLDFAALVSTDNLGELALAQTKMKQYGLASDFGGGIACWKGAAVSADLVVFGNGAAGSAVAVVERATGTCAKYALLDSAGNATTFAMDGGLDFDAAGAYLYTNDGAAQNTVVKWAVDISARTLKQTATYVASDFTRIRNLSVATVGDAAYAFFGEGAAKTGKVGTLNLADGTFATLLTDAENLGGDIANVKVAQADGETYVVAQADDAATGVYLVDPETWTATLEKAIDAATMKSLYGTADGGQYRNFEMTADGRFALVMNNAGAKTRLAVIGSTETLVPSGKPTLTVESDYGNAFTPTLTWTEDEGVTAETVRIFRAQAGKVGTTALADVPLGTRTYADESAVGGVTYAYSVAYVHTVNGKAIVGARSEEAEALALTDLKTKRKEVVTSDSRTTGTVNNLFDGNTTTIHSASQWNERVAMRFTERVQLLKARYMPADWGTVHRGDRLRVSGNNDTSDWTVGLTQVGVGPVVYDEWTWYDVTLNGSAAQDEGWECLALASGYGSAPYLNLREVDFYGALVKARAATLAKTSEAGRDDTPTAVAAEGGHALAWTESGSLVGVSVLRSRTAEGPFVEVGRAEAGVGAFDDTTAVDGVVYYYRLAYLTECEGVVYAGVPTASVIDYGARLERDCRAATLQSWTSGWSGGYAFDDDPSTVVNGPNGADRFGIAFAEPAVINAIALRGPEWAVNANGYRIDNVGIYAAPSGITGIADTTQAGYKQITDEAVGQFAKIGATPSGCRTANTWFTTPLADGNAHAYLYLYRTNPGWFASISGLRVYGFTQATVEAAKAQVVWPVEDLVATMNGDTAELAWRNANARTTAIRVERRVNGGDWTELATLEATATGYADATAEIGRHNEYRVWSEDATERVYATVTVTPLLDEGKRTFVKACGAASDPLFADAFALDGDSWFKATLSLAGTNAAALGVSGDVRIVAKESAADSGNCIQVLRGVADGALQLYLKGPGHESGTFVAADEAKPNCDGIRLVREGLAATAFYHTAEEGWVRFANASFTAAPFAASLYVGVGTHTTGVTETTATAFDVGRFRLRADSGLVLFVR